MSPVTTRSLQKKLRAKLSAGAAYGGWTVTASTQIIEVMSMTGIDWIGIDTQHSIAGPFGARSLYELILAGERHDMPTVVRTPWAEPGAVMQILDAGAAGIIIPMINTVEDAIEAVSWTRYPPDGVRSLGTVRAAMGDAEFSLAKANEDVLVFVMIETKQAYESAREILSVPGIAGVFIGPWDLTISMTGETRQPQTHDRMEEIILEIAGIAHERGLFVGCATADSTEARRRAEQGFELINSLSDLGGMIAGVKRDLAIANGSAAQSTAKESLY